MPSLEILLATYNGGEFLTGQLDSLLAQSYQDFSIIIADDGSTDTTLAVLADYQRRFPDRIRVLDTGTIAGGPRANFARLLDAASADYVMFSDHDDVWLPNKIALSLERMRSAEAVHGRETPLLFHADLVVAGPSLEELHASFWEYSNIDPARNTLANLLMMNTAAGCTVTINRALCDSARPIPVQATMHDHWCILIAAVTGKIEYAREGIVLYRQHRGNTVGARKWRGSYVLRSALATVLTRASLIGVSSKVLQARALMDRCAASMTTEQRETVATLAGLWSLSRSVRFWKMQSKNILMNSFWRNVGLALTVSVPRTVKAPPAWYSRLLQSRNDMYRRTIPILKRWSIKRDALLSRLKLRPVLIDRRIIAADLPPGSDEEETQKGSVSYLRCLKWIHSQLKPSLYLEIGVGTGKSIKLAKCRAVGIDPAPKVTVPLAATTTIVKATSDEFFEADAQARLGQKPDLTFIDGMHFFEYALRDFMHAEKVASPHGLIIVDDIFPNRPAQAARKRRTRTWTGDVWKLHAILKQYRPDLYLLALDTSPTGLLLIAGLDPTDRILSDNYEAIIDAYGQNDRPPEEVITRLGAVDPTRSTLKRIAELLRRSRKGRMRRRELVWRLHVEQLFAFGG